VPGQHNGLTGLALLLGLCWKPVAFASSEAFIGSGSNAGHPAACRRARKTVGIQAGLANNTVNCLLSACSLKEAREALVLVDTTK
jgi:hypothetical protein